MLILDLKKDSLMYILPIWTYLNNIVHFCKILNVFLTIFQHGRYIEHCIYRLHVVYTLSENISL